MSNPECSALTGSPHSETSTASGWVSSRCARLTPQLFGPIIVGIFLDEAAGHVYAETVRAQSEPEIHDVLDEQASLLRFG